MGLQLGRGNKKARSICSEQGCVCALICLVVAGCVLEVQEQVNSLGRGWQRAVRMALEQETWELRVLSQQEAKGPWL